MMYQLSRDESFDAFVFRRLRGLSSIVLCEGVTEEKVFKKLVEKLGIEVAVPIGVTECGGIPHIYDVAAVVLSLIIVISRKVRRIGVIVDGEEMTPIERVKSILHSLKSRGIAVDVTEEVCNQLYRVGISGPRSIELLIAVNGVYSYPFERHSIHDHGLLLAQRLGAVDSSRVANLRLAEEAVGRDELLKLIDRATPNTLRECFKHIACMIELLFASRPQRS